MDKRLGDLVNEAIVLAGKDPHVLNEEGNIPAGSITDYKRYQEIIKEINSLEEEYISKNQKS